MAANVQRLSRTYDPRLPSYAQVDVQSWGVRHDIATAIHEGAIGVAQVFSAERYSLDWTFSSTMAQVSPLLSPSHSLPLFLCFSLRPRAGRGGTC